MAVRHSLVAVLALVLAGCPTEGKDDVDPDVPTGDTTMDTPDDTLVDTDDTPVDTPDTDDTTADTDDTTVDTDDTLDDTGDTDGVDTDPGDTDVDTDLDTDLDTDVDTDTAPPMGSATVVVCPTVVPAATTGVCDVTAGTGGILLSGTVLGPETTWENGQVLVDPDGTITCVGCDCEGILPDPSTAVCGNGVISPALINAHDHITFSESAPLAPSTTRYDHRHGWRGSVSTPSNPSGTAFAGVGNRWVEVRQILSGTTTMAGSGAADGMVRNPDRDRNEGIDLPEVDYQTFPLGDSNESFRNNCDWNYDLTEREAAALPVYLSHVAEGIDFYASEEFRCQSTSFDGGQNLTQPNTTHIHGVGLDAIDYSVMASRSTDLIWSPRSNISLYGNTADVRLLHGLGGIIGLGTDWTYTGSMNMLRELSCADDWNRDYLDGYFSDIDLWRMATVNNAVALAADHRIGSIVEGLVADIAVYDGSAGIHHRAVIDAGAGDVALVLRGGEVLVGEADSVGALRSNCDALDVCGTPMAICTQDEWGTSYAALVSATAGSYPAFFCATPTDEPTCVPSRPGEYNGLRTATDGDGDGIADADDNCPTVFNPIRPIDGGAQPDANANGIGDSCDSDPLPADIDGDGIANMLDNCPLEPNPLQEDMDTDALGDVCDFCPFTSAPSGICPPALGTILDVRTTLPVGSAVTVDAVVTSVTGNGFSIQDPTATGGNAGLWVFSGNAPGVVRGDHVRVEGTIDEYFDELQIEQPTVTILGTLPEPVPLVLTTTQANEEQYEGMLVTVDGSVTNAAYDCAVDGGCTDADLWEIDGPTGVVVYSKVYESGDWAAQVGTTPVTGVMTFRWNRRRIMPRVSADFGP